MSGEIETEGEGKETRERERETEEQRRFPSSQILILLPVWQNLTGSQLPEEAGKSSLQTSSPIIIEGSCGTEITGKNLPHLTELDVVWDSFVVSFTIISFYYVAIVLVSMNLSNNHFDLYFPLN